MADEIHGEFRRYDGTPYRRALYATERMEIAQSTTEIVAAARQFQREASGSDGNPNWPDEAVEPVVARLADEIEGHAAIVEIQQDEIAKLRAALKEALDGWTENFTAALSEMGQGWQTKHVDALKVEESRIAELRKLVGE